MVKLDNIISPNLEPILSLSKMNDVRHWMGSFDMARAMWRGGSSEDQLAVMFGDTFLQAMLVQAFRRSIVIVGEGPLAANDGGWMRRSVIQVVTYKQTKQRGFGVKFMLQKKD